MRLLKVILKATGKKGVQVDRMPEKAIQTTRREPYTYVQYARSADDIVVLIDSHPQHVWLAKAV